MRVRFSTLLILLVLAPGAAWASDGGNLLPLLNAFIAAIAKDSPQLKADIHLLGPGASVQPGFQRGRSAALGDYEFRPKTFDQLTAGERDWVVNHPNLKAFIISVRGQNIYPLVSSANAGKAPPPGWIPVEGAPQVGVTFRARISPEEMLHSRPTTVPVMAEPVR